MGSVFGGFFVGKVGGPVVVRFAPRRGMGSRCSACLVSMAMIVMSIEVRSERRCVRVGTGGDIEKLVHCKRGLGCLGLR
jgi:hypothetical protein